MASETKQKYYWRKFAHDAADIAAMEKVGLKPTRMLTNEGQVAIMGPEGRVALVDCQTKFKRGEGWKAECAKRDALADAIVDALNRDPHSKLVDR